MRNQQFHNNWSGSQEWKGTKQIEQETRENLSVQVKMHMSPYYIFKQACGKLYCKYLASF